MPSGHQLLTSASQNPKDQLRSSVSKSRRTEAFIRDTKIKAIIFQRLEYALNLGKNPSPAVRGEKYLSSLVELVLTLESSLDEFRRHSITFGFDFGRSSVTFHFLRI